MNIVLIVSDTFRRDHIGCYGNKKIKTPNLDRLARKSVIFDNAYSGSFPTMPARVDILTGKWSFTFMGWSPLPRKEIVLPNLLKNAGYLTKSVVDTPFYLRNGYGYDRGFIDFEWIRGQLEYNKLGERKEIGSLFRFEEDYFAPATMLASERWLQNHYKDKFFLYIDTWDPHEPWDPPKYYTEHYLSNYDGTLCKFPCYGKWQEMGFTKQDLEKTHACYCGEITMVDRWIGHLLNGIEKTGLTEETIIVFTTDHGFYFGEHEQIGKATKKENMPPFFSTLRRTNPYTLTCLCSCNRT